MLANYDDGEEKEEEPSNARRLRGRFTLTNTGMMILRRGHWQLFIPSFRAMQFNDSGTMLGNSGLKASNSAAVKYTFYVQC